ncbi:MAG TPA: GNAT family N-acetyltransferase [Anaerolineales bacterium]
MSADQIHIRSLQTIDEMMQVVELQALVWPGDAVVVPGHLLLTVAHNGGVLLGAFAGDELVGFVLGFLGVDEQSPDRVAMARLKHCSHMLGVRPDYRDRGIGQGLKLAQRAQVLKQGVRLITWTFDPLQSRNAHVNIRRLGGLCRRYLANRYGAMRDEVNEGLPSDRFEVEWWITTPRVETRISGSRPPLDLAHFLSAGATKVNPAVLGDDDLLRPAEQVAELEGNVALVEIPSDFDRLRAADLGLANGWRLQTRRIFQSAFDAGYLVSDFVHLAGEQFPRSYYLLIHGEGTLG